MLKRVALATSLLAALNVAGTADASNGAGANKTSSWISAPVVVSSGSVAPTDTTAALQYGDTVTFDVSTTQTSDPFVNLTCYQNGVLVLNAWSAFFPGGLGDGTFGLGSTVW